MPHVLMICFGKGNQEEAWRAFDEAVGEDVPRVTLCDTYSDEVDEVLRAAETLGESLVSIRLDTTSSRRGDFRHIVREVRWGLEVNGHENIDIFVSGGITPESMQHLWDVDGFGAGGYISNANPIDFALDIVEVEGTPAAKRGKLLGKKQVYRTDDGDHHITLASQEEPLSGDALLDPLICDGEIV